LEGKGKRQLKAGKKPKLSLELWVKSEKKKINLTFLSCLPELECDFEGLGYGEGDRLRLGRQQ